MRFPLFLEDYICISKQPVHWYPTTLDVFLKRSNRVAPISISMTLWTSITSSHNQVEGFSCDWGLRSDWQRDRPVYSIRACAEYGGREGSVLFWLLPHTGPEFSCVEQGSAVVLFMQVLISSSWRCAVHLWAKWAEADPDVSTSWVTPRSARGKTPTETPSTGERKN